MRAHTMLLTLAVVVALCGRARADAGDGVYGRLDGDFVLSVGAGGGYRTGGDGAFVGDLRFRYLDTAGLVVAPEVTGSSVRVVLAGDFRPLFLIRFLLNAWSGRAFGDLLLDSVGLELGVAFDRLDQSDRGAALAVGFGLDVPLVLPGALLDGLVLRLGARHVRAGPTDRAGPGPVADWTFYGALTLRGVVDTGLASRELPRFRPDR